MGIIERRRSIIASQPHLVTATGGSLAVNIAEPKVQKLAVTFAPVQSGSGTPSPSNVRPIYGWSEIPVGMTPGYGDVLAAVPDGKYGTIDLSTGVMTATHGVSTVSSLSWSYESEYTRFTAELPNFMSNGGARTTEIFSNKFQSIYDKRPVGDVPDYSIYCGSRNRYVYVKVPTTYTTEAAFEEAFGDSQIVYPLATPETLQLTGITPRPGTVTVSLFQYGGGTPSPTNVRPIIPVVDGPSITLGSTYYGGVVDLVSGTMTVTHKKVIYDSSASISSTNAFSRTVRARLRDDTMDFYVDREHSMYDYMSYTDNWSADTPWLYGLDSSYPHYFWFFLPLSELSEATNAGVKAYLGNHPLSVYAKLTTPQTVQLTPQTIAALRGQQTVTSPAGVVEISYWTH